MANSLSWIDARYSLTWSMIGYWRMNEAAGANDAIDASGNGRTLNQSNSPGSGAGILGTARTFVSASSQNFRRNIDSPMGFVGDFTITGWFNLSDKTGDPRGVGKAAEFILGYSVGSQRFTTLLFDQNVNLVEVHNSSGVDPVLGTWYFMAVRVSGTTLSISQNAGTADTGSIASLGPIPNANAFEVGSYANGNYWNGSIQAIGKWNRALGDSEITELYNGGSGRDPVSNP